MRPFWKRLSRSLVHIFFTSLYSVTPFMIVQTQTVCVVNQHNPTIQIIWLLLSNASAFEYCCRRGKKTYNLHMVDHFNTNAFSLYLLCLTVELMMSRLNVRSQMEVCVLMLLDNTTTVVNFIVQLTVTFCKGWWHHHFGESFTLAANVTFHQDLSKNNWRTHYHNSQTGCRRMLLTVSLHLTWNCNFLTQNWPYFVKDKGKREQLWGCVICFSTGDSMP